MDVLMIGGTGTISRAIVLALLRRGARVTVFTRGQREEQPPPEVRVLRGERREDRIIAALQELPRRLIAGDAV